MTDDVRAFQGTYIRSNQSFISRLFFTWATPFYEQARKGKFHISMYGKLEKQYEI
jgi:hypothetical protein